MFEENSTCNPTVIDLPPLCLQSMTQLQLENLVPKLVSQATGRTSSVFGIVSQKPDWWPKYIDWIDPDQLCLRYEDPCETLRDIVRSCYQHCEKENLLHADTSFTRSMPSSPSSAELEMCVAEEATTAKPCNGSENATAERKEQNGEKKEHADVDVHIRLNETNNRKAENNEINPEQEQRKKHNDNITCKTMQEKDLILESDSQPIEIIGSDEERSDTSKQIQEKGQDSTLSIESLSPSIISEIDKHIMESISSTFLNFTNLKPIGRRKGSKVKDLSNFESPLPRKSQFLGINVNGSFPEQSHTLSKPDLRDSKVQSKDKREDIKSIDTEKDQQPDTGKASTEAKQKSEPVSSASEDDDVVWICFLCAKGFSNQTDLMAHQEKCEDSKDVDDSANGSAVSSGKSDCDQCKETMDIKTKPNHGESVEPSFLTKVGSDRKSLPLNFSNINRKCPSRKRKRNMEVYIPPPREIYFESLGLVPTPKVDLIKTPQKNPSQDCQIVDLTLDEDKSPQSQPMTPRTHLIMAQLSREDCSGGRRRQLSFSQSSPPKLPKKVESDSESSDSSIEEPTRKKNVPCKSVILAIPLTSLLGQRLKKHWQSDNKIPVISDVESFCQTSNVQYDSVSEELERKSKFTEKLRHRPPPQLTFRYTKKYINKWFHKYKFNKADKEEFKHNLATGLEYESRKILRRMKKCKVSLERIGKKEIRYWTSSRPKLLHSQSIQPMRQNQFEQLRMRLSNPGPRGIRPLQLLNSSIIQIGQRRERFPVPVPLFAQTQKLGVPIPQFLVRNVPAGENKVRMEIMPVVQRTFVPVSKNSLVVKTEQRKKAFHKPPVNSNSVICLSSDEEDNIETFPSCSKCQSPRTACVCSGKGRPKIGPASFMKHQRSLQQRAQMLRKSTNSNRNSPPVVHTGKADSVSARLFGKNPGKGSVDPSLSEQGSRPNMTFTQVKKESVGTTVCSKAANDIQILDIKSDSSVSSSQTRESRFTHIRMVNGKIVSQVTGNSSPTGSQDSTTEHQPGSLVKQENEQALSDAEYMDFEVICIDSDEET